MQRTILCDKGRRQLWAFWGVLRNVKDGGVFTFGDAKHGDAMRDAGLMLRAMADGLGVFETLSYNDQEWRFQRRRSEEEERADDDARRRVDPDFRSKLPNNLVLCESGVKYLRDLSELFLTEERISPDAAEILAQWVYAIYEGTHIRMPGSRVDFETFRYCSDEYDLLKLEAGEHPLYRYDDPGYRPFYCALRRGERCEIDERFFNDRLEVLPPIFMNRTVELVDGTTRKVAFGAAEGDNVPIEGFWSERPEPTPWHADFVTVVSELANKVVLFRGRSYKVTEVDSCGYFVEVVPEIGLQESQRLAISEIEALLAPRRYFAQMTRLRTSQCR